MSYPNRNLSKETYYTEWDEHHCDRMDHRSGPYCNTNPQKKVQEADGIENPLLNKATSDFV
jgi:hypothetical protein